MQTKLDRLLESIDPVQTLEETDQRTDEALNSFPVQTAVIVDWNEFKSCLVRLLVHVENEVLRLRQPRPVNLDTDWWRCCKILREVYGPGGEKAAFEMARTGNEGGLYAVLKTFARRQAYQYSQNEIAAKVSHYWNGLSVEEKLAAPREYVQKYGYLLPSELTEGSAARIYMSFPDVLAQHPTLCRKLRQVGR